MGVIAITGSAGGIGRATRRRLEAEGHRVIGVDVVDADVVADLATPSGRDAMVAGVTEASGGLLRGVVAGAGVMGDDSARIVSINFFGAVATLEGLRPLLVAADADGAAVAISSNSATTAPGVPATLVDACLSGDEAVARDVATDVHPLAAYPASKLALARWVRRTAAAWAGDGLRLNAVAPGLISTPMTAETEEMILGLGDVFPIPARRPGEADEVAGLLAYLLSDDARFFAGSVVFMDGGTDAAVRSDDWPAARR
jgi:NAD(P)-dependent dehydrogenase (short-subunit alcohol dehydrogenase family)